ncbi:transglutaminase-like cysteine peptidase [Desulforhopalus sp. 52FAK]
MKYLLVMCCVVFLFLNPASGVTADYQPWSENVFRAVEQEYGEGAVKRLRYLHTMILENQDLHVMEKLKLVNRTLNNIPWIADSQHWKKSDYWASPMETITTFGGDCEDFAVAKWLVLRHLGIKPEHFRLAYVKIKATGENHMVLLYISNPSEPPEQWEAYVLDNYDPEVKKGSERTDLIAVYLTDRDGTIVIIGTRGKDHFIKGVFKDRKTKKLDDLIKKIQEDRERFKELNDGRALLP